ncbi:RcpC/CpaB family pilus assembly protein [Streptomyces sp. NPDC059637]|uniref:RcpC/CpaB family pilus assembly protein n=1 Tax=Streptomyces sp. NPDC059637 TaxID=3347752 RepID=UPI0036B97A54
MTVVVLAAAAAALAATSAGSSTAPRTRPVLVAARDLPAGSRVDRGDLEVARMPLDRAPDDSVHRAAQAEGRTLTGPLLRGAPLTVRDLVGSQLLRAASPAPGGASARAAGRDVVAAPVRIADASAVRLVRPGDRIDVLAGPAPGGTAFRDRDAADPAAVRARVVASGARVVAVPEEEDRGGGTAGGALVVITVPRTTAAELAGAAAGSSLSLVVARAPGPAERVGQPPPGVP